MKELIKIQSELKAPKSKQNAFGGFRYRSAEDILEAVKPLLAQYGCLLTLSDDVLQIGDRFFIRSTATFTAPDGKQIAVSAFAAHAFDKKAWTSRRCPVRPAATPGNMLSPGSSCSTMKKIRTTFRPYRPTSNRWQ